MSDFHDDLVYRACLMKCENTEIKTRRRRRNKRVDWMKTCKTCIYRDAADGNRCCCPKINDDYMGPKHDELSYSYHEGGWHTVGLNFGCVHHKEKPTCDDCKHSFRNPFDELFCKANRKATRVCKLFEQE